MTEPGSISIEELFTDQYARLVRALAITHGTEAAKDAVQDAFVAAERRWSRVQRYDDPAGWIRRVAINSLRNRTRNESRRRAILRRHEHEVARTVPGPSMTIDVDLRAAIARLPERQRLAVTLYYLADVGVDDIARALGVRAGTVKSNLHDARRNLRDALGAHDEHARR